MRILLDLDGVLANFHKAYLELVGKPELYDNWPLGMYSLENVLGISTNEFWGRIKDGFFYHLEAMPDFHELLAVVQKFDKEFVICTSPGPKYWAASEKVQWIRNKIDTCFPTNRIVIAGDKSLLAKPTNILIDDWEANVTSFRAAGGKAVLCPRPWNPHFNHSHTTPFSVELQLSYLYK